MKPSMAIQVRQLSSAKCMMAASALHAAVSDVEGRASEGLSRKVTLRSSTEACRFMWIRVMESPCCLAWKCSSRVSSEATMEMLQPTREMYVRGASSSSGIGAGESCMRTAK